MAFTPKTWVGRSVEYPGQVKLIPTGEPGVYRIERYEGTVYSDGDLVSDTALNDLEQRILTGIGNAPQVSSGVWTPEIYGTTTAGSPTYASRSGIYYKIGRLVFLFFNLSLSNAGGIQGNVNIRGLPFVAMTTGSVLCTASSVGAQITGYASGEGIYSLNTPSGGVQNPANDFAIYTGSAWYLTD